MNILQLNLDYYFMLLLKKNTTFDMFKFEYGQIYMYYIIFVLYYIYILYIFTLYI